MGRRGGWGHCWGHFWGPGPLGPMAVLSWQRACRVLKESPSSFIVLVLEDLGARASSGAVDDLF